MNMMSLSAGTTNTQFAVDGVTVKPTLAPEENAYHASNREAVVTPKDTHETASGPRYPPPAWLSREPSQESGKIKLPPVTVPAKKKTKQQKVTNKTPKHNSKGKLNTAIEPLQEETNESNVNA